MSGKIDSGKVEAVPMNSCPLESSASRHAHALSRSMKISPTEQAEISPSPIKAQK